MGWVHADENKQEHRSQTTTQNMTYWGGTYRLVVPVVFFPVLRAEHTTTNRFVSTCVLQKKRHVSVERFFV